MARLLSLVERGGPTMRQVAAIAYRWPVPYTVGLTGAPGAGKSSLTGRILTEARKGWASEDQMPEGAVDQVAALAVDPTSPFTGGAILGDRVRMQEHATDVAVYVRSMASRGHLGGLALAVPDALRVLGAAGFPLVVLETVGVGQVEVEVASAVDTTVVVVTPGWGDAVQANKAGLLEVADLFVVNKADRPGGRETRRDLEQMLDLSAASGWRPPIIETVATSGQGVEELWAAVGRHRSHLVRSGLLVERRNARLEGALRRVVAASLAQRLEALLDDPATATLRKGLRSGAVDPYDAADQLMVRLGATGP